MPGVAVEPEAVPCRASASRRMPRARPRRSPGRPRGCARPRTWSCGGMTTRRAIATVITAAIAADGRRRAVRSPPRRCRSARRGAVSVGSPVPSSRCPSSVWAAVRRAAVIRSTRDSSLHTCPTPRRISHLSSRPHSNRCVRPRHARSCASRRSRPPARSPRSRSHLSADVAPARHGDDSELGTGRFVLLYDPDEPEAWGGRFRVVCFAQAPARDRHRPRPVPRGCRMVVARRRARRTGRRVHRRIRHRDQDPLDRIRRAGTRRATARRSSCVRRGRPSTPPSAPHVEGWGELLCMLAGCRLDPRG